MLDPCESVGEMLYRVQAYILTYLTFSVVIAEVVGHVSVTSLNMFGRIRAVHVGVDGNLHRLFTTKAACQTRSLRKRQRKQGV